MLTALESSKCGSPGMAPEDLGRDANKAMLIKQTLTADKV
jgi:hypothetical protein